VRRPWVRRPDLRRPDLRRPDLRRPGLRTMMLVPVLLTVSLGFTALALYVQRTAQADLVAAVDDELTRAHRAGVTRLAADPTLADPTPTSQTPTDPSRGLNAPIQLVLAPDGSVLEHTITQNPFSATELAALAAADGTITVAHGPRYRALVTIGPNGGRIVTALPLSNADASLAGLRRSLLLGGLVVFLLCSLVVWWIAAALARPVTRMTDVANQIAGGALSTDVDPPGGSRETARLAADLQHMLTRLRATIAASDAATRQATQARAAMQRFLADASHELRTPLTALRGYSDLYAGKMLAEGADLDRAMQRIGSESQRLTSLVNGMLQLARDGGTDRRPHQDDLHRDVDLHQVVADVVQDLRAAYPDHPITAPISPPDGTASSPAGPSPAGPSPASPSPANPSPANPRPANPQLTNTRPTSTVRGDPGLLHRALLNLGANACQHTDPGTAVRFDLSTTATGTTLAVIDHGPGIGPAHAEKIFEPFYRADTSRSRTGSAGAGLGLALAQQIAAQHQAVLAHSTTPGGGATFTLTLPRG
jgi:two-component system, OmpR family, sensor kinase